MTEQFRKVYINSEADLPKETGSYYAHEKDASQHTLSLYQFMVNDDQYSKDWLEIVEYYFYPDNEKDKVQALYKEMGEWSKVAFPDSDSWGHLNKLLEETEEAMDEPDNITEYADCMLVLMAAAYKAEISFDHLIKASQDKLKLNKARKWERKENGIYQHIPEQKEKAKEEIELRESIASLTSEIEEGDEKQDPVICVKCHEYSWDCKCAEKPELVSADSPHIEAMKFLKKKHGEQDYSDIPFWHVEDMVEYATLRAAQEKGKVPKNGYCSCDTQYAACDDKVECNGCKYWVESQTPVQSVSEQIEMYKECFERFIPDQSKDEAMLFLSTYGSGLAKTISSKDK